MVDKIDKALPNVREKAIIESPEEVEIEETKKLQEVNEEGIEITKNEDGSAEVEFTKTTKITKPQEAIGNKRM